MQDKKRKGRGNSRKGSDHPSSKLNEEEVKKIKIRALNGENQTKIANDFNISRRSVSSIKTNNNWKHLNGS